MLAEEALAALIAARPESEVDKQARYAALERAGFTAVHQADYLPLFEALGIPTAFVTSDGARWPMARDNVKGTGGFMMAPKRSIEVLAKLFSTCRALDAGLESDEFEFEDQYGRTPLRGPTRDMRQLLEAFLNEVPARVRARLGSVDSLETVARLGGSKALLALMKPLAGNSPHSTDSVGSD